ncbi:hypothetical protein HN747_00675 [archaeon]|nr:hypothetical protein [archaeon]
MNLEFLFWFFLIGIILSVIQDLKRREIDIWLCNILLIGGITFTILFSIINSSINPLINLTIALLITFILRIVLYNSRVFAGGDARLLFSLGALFVGSTISLTLINISVYLMILLFSGGIYGLLALMVIYIRNFKKTNKNLKPKLKKIKYHLFLLASIVLMVIGIFVDLLFIIGILLSIYPLLYLFAKTLEEELMISNKKISQLQEGDWLAETVKVGNKKIEYSWDGLEKEDIALIKRYKKFVKVKQGLPFAPSFLLAHILYWVFGKTIIVFLTI